MARRRRPPRAGALTELPPLKIAAQIAALQAVYYLAALILLVFTTLVAGIPFSLDLVLGWERVRGDTTQGWLMAFVWILDGGLVMSVAIVVFIARSKLVPDFALTVHFLHLVFTTLYTHSLPRNSMWWATMLSSAALSVGLGVWGSRYRELQPVYFFGGRILGSGTATTSTNGGSNGGARRDNVSHEASEDMDAEDGDISLGRGKGLGRDGQGQYEMVQMKSAA